MNKYYIRIGDVVRFGILFLSVIGIIYGAYWRITPIFAVGLTGCVTFWGLSEFRKQKIVDIEEVEE